MVRSASALGARGFESLTSSASYNTGGVLSPASSQLWRSRGVSTLFRRTCARRLGIACRRQGERVKMPPVEVLETRTRRRPTASRHRPAPEAITAVLVEFPRS